MNFQNYQHLNAIDELLDAENKSLPAFKKVFDYFDTFSIDGLKKKQKELEASMLNMGITFSIYEEDSGLERIIPFDIIPRLIEAKEWVMIEEALKQRVLALNEFLKDIYTNQKIIRDKIIPADIVLGSKGFLKQCLNVIPQKGIYNHITGTDLVRNSSGEILVLEDNLRCPSGVSYMLQGREMLKQALPNLLSSVKIKSISEYSDRLLATLRYITNSENPTVAVLTPGIYNSAYYEHSFLALQMGVELVDYRDLIVQDNYVKMRTTRGLKTVDVLYRRLDDIYIDRTAFYSESMIGIPGLFEVYKSGNLGLANALGSGVADDKVIYSFVPKIIKYYLDEEPLLQNVETYLCYNKLDLEYVLANLEKLVIKEANEAGGKGMLIGAKASKEEINQFKNKIKDNPRNFIAQPIVSFSTSPCLIDKQIEARRVDLRPYTLFGEELYVTPGGLTRVALEKGSFVVNSSQGGGSKDTWVLKN